MSRQSEKKKNPMPRRGKRQIPASEMQHVTVHTADCGPEGFVAMMSREEMKKSLEQL